MSDNENVHGRSPEQREYRKERVRIMRNRDQRNYRISIALQIIGIAVLVVCCAYLIAGLLMFNSTLFAVCRIDVDGENYRRTSFGGDGYCGCGSFGDRPQSQKCRAAFRHEESREVRTPDCYLSGRSKNVKRKGENARCRFQVQGRFLPLCSLIACFSIFEK